MCFPASGFGWGRLYKCIKVLPKSTMCLHRVVLDPNDGRFCSDVISNVFPGHHWHWWFSMAAKALNHYLYMFFFTC